MSSKTESKNDVNENKLSEPELKTISNNLFLNTTENLLEIVDYNDRSIAVFGNTKKFLEKLKAIGGKFNKFLVYKDEYGIVSKKPGWIFSKKNKDELLKLRDTSINNGDINVNNNVNNTNNNNVNNVNNTNNTNNIQLTNDINQTFENMQKNIETMKDMQKNIQNTIQTVENIQKEIKEDNNYIKILNKINNLEKICEDLQTQINSLKKDSNKK